MIVEIMTFKTTIIFVHKFFFKLNLNQLRCSNAASLKIYCLLEGASEFRTSDVQSGVTTSS